MTSLSGPRQLAGPFACLPRCTAIINNVVVSPTRQGGHAEPPEPRLLRLCLRGMGRLGEAVAESDGKQVFVIGGIPGEEVVAEVVRERRSHIVARAVKVVEPSPHRVAAPCRYVDNCSGCQWQHIAYEHQLELKRLAVVDALERVGGITGAEVLPTLPSPQQLGYRNHARFTISRPSAPSGAGRLGFVNRETRRHVDIDECLLMAPRINEMLTVLQGRVAETTQLSVRVGVNSGSWMLQPTLQHPDIPFDSGQPHYEERVAGYAFRVASPSFFQVNTPQLEQMACVVSEALGLSGSETLVDAYAGVGTFAVLLAASAKRVIAIEESGPAVADARDNAKGLSNVEFRLGRTESVLAEVAAETPIDAVILDPPRAGCLPGTLDALLAAQPSRVAYVSCDPETLARDLAVLTAGPFRLEGVQPVDMFPQTHHVECIAMLALDRAQRAAADARRNLVLASASPRRREIIERLLGEPIDAVDAAVPEPPADSADPVALAQERALAKAEAVAKARSRGTVIGADTVVTIDDRALGKPGDDAEADAMLRALRGREHRVVTAIALVDATSGASLVVHRASFAPAAAVRGCYLNVVGLPVCTLLKQLERFGVRIHVAMQWPELMRCPDCAKHAPKPPA